MSRVAHNKYSEPYLQGVVAFTSHWKLTGSWFVFFGLLYFFLLKCLQCFDAVGWAAGRASGL